VKVIREAIINAIAHRDYTIDGAKIQLEVHPDRIIVKSPGQPVPPITMAALKNFSATSFSRNKKLTFIFNEMAYMEESALGMDTFKSIREKYDLPLPVVDYDGLNIVVTFPRTTEAIKDISSKKGVEDLNDEELVGYEWIKTQSDVSKLEYAKHFDFRDKKAQRHLVNMKKADLVTDNGKPATSRNYRYVVITDD